MGEYRYDAIFLTSATDGGERQLQAPAAFTPGKQSPDITQYKIGWAQGLVWTFWSYPYQESNHDSSAVPPVGQSPHWLSYPGFWAGWSMDFKDTTDSFNAHKLISHENGRLRFYFPRSTRYISVIFLFRWLRVAQFVPKTRVSFRKGMEMANADSCRCKCSIRHSCCKAQLSHCRKPPTSLKSTVFVELMQEYFSADTHHCTLSLHATSYKLTNEEV